MSSVTRPAMPVRWVLIVFLTPLYGLASIVLALTIRVVAVEAFDTEGPSMEPTLLSGDRFVVDKSAYGLVVPLVDEALSTWGAPEVGDVVVVRSPEGIDVVKRVVAVGGDRIAIEDDVIVLNGVRVETRALGHDEGAEAMRFEERVGERTWQVLRSPMSLPESMPAVVVPEGHVFVMGDHRDRSNDSRNPRVGVLPISRVRGRATYVYWSSDEDGHVRWERAGGEIR